ncbi:MAG: AAA family ATPase [Candidatus Thermoplasmatota archaeon]|nr:AAA family ATPase [Candidatus Thermoplasmatota archaeon]
MFDHLKSPQFYGPKVSSVQLLQTHISYVALTGTYAYKVKKPVNFGFLDFSSLDKRKYYCEEELRLNKRLCPEIYLDVVPITKKNTSLELSGDGPIVEYAIKMREFPQKNIMTNMLAHRKITEDTIDALVEILIDFYHAQEPSAEVTSYGEVAAVKRNIDENFEQVKPMVGITVPQNTYESIKATAAQCFNQNEAVFRQRITEGRISECHGDLHSGNIVVTDDGKIYIFDCIEFNDRFRFCDVASDIGFLAMDLDYLNYPYLSSYLIQRYIKKSGDAGILSVLNFYKSYRAFVRGKVHGFQLNDPHIDAATKHLVIATAQHYFQLSLYYANLCAYEMHRTQPLLLLVSGLSGTGKSTVAQKLSVDYHAEQINTDVVRKQAAGIDQFERHHDQLNTGLYDPRNVDETYERVMQRSAAVLNKGGNVVLDATFQKKKYREMTAHLAATHHATFVSVHCVCADEIVKKRLEDRLKKKSVSDGRWEIYLAQKTTFEPLTPEGQVLVMDTGDESLAYRMSFFWALLSRLMEVP